MRPAARPTGDAAVVAVFDHEHSLKATAKLLGFDYRYVKTVVEGARPGYARSGRRRVGGADVEVFKRCLRQANCELGGVLTRAEYDGFATEREVREGQRWPRSVAISKALEGWGRALVAAGLEAQGVRKGQASLYSREQCLDFGREVMRAVGHPPTLQEYQNYRSGPGQGVPASATITRQFGSWREFLGELGDDPQSELAAWRTRLTPVSRPDVLEAFLATAKRGGKAEAVARRLIETAARVLSNGRCTALDYPWGTLRADDLETVDHRRLAAGLFGENHVQILKRMARVACRLGVLDGVEAERIRAFKVRNSDRPELSPVPTDVGEIVEAIRRSGAYPKVQRGLRISGAAMSCRDRAMFELVANGVRPPEVVALDPADWESASGRLRVRCGPRSRHRVVRLTERAGRAVDDLFAIAEVESGVLRSGQGKRLSESIVAAGIGRLCRHADERTVNPRDLWRWGLRQMVIEGQSEAEVVTEAGLGSVAQLRRLCGAGKEAGGGLEMGRASAVPGESRPGRRDASVLVATGGASAVVTAVDRGNSERSAVVALDLSSIVATIRESGPFREEEVDSGRSPRVREAGYRAVFELVVEASLRPGEVAALEVSDWNASTRRLEIRAGAPKRHRTVHLGPRATAAMEVWVCVAGIQVGSMFGGRHSSPASIGTVRRTIDALCQHAGLTRMWWPQARCWGLRQRLDGGMTAAELAKASGHSSVAELSREMGPWWPTVCRERAA